MTVKRVDDLRPGDSAINVHIRWMIRRDMPEVLSIESGGFANPWTEDEFLRCLRQRNNTVMVAELGDTIAAFIVYELHKNKLHILNLAVRADLRRQGIGRQMIEKLTGKLSQQCCNVITTEVRETNLDTQLFLSATGFIATGVLKDFYFDTTEDAYAMQFRYGWESYANG